MQSEQTSPQPQSAEAKGARLYYLDWLRVIATLGVFLFHALNVFNTFDFHIKNAQQSEAISIFEGFLFPWGMPLFFMMSGTGCWFALRKRTGRQYIRERFNRLFIPFVVGSLLLSPIQLWLEYNHKIQTGVVQGSFREFLGTIPFQANPRFFGAVGYHLWFLAFLFLFALITLPLFQWLKGPSGQRFVAGLARLCERRGAILLLAIAPIAVRLATHPFFPEEHHWADFLTLMTFFALGFLLYSDERFAQAIRRDRWILLAAVVLSTLAAAYLSLTAETFDIEAGPRTLSEFSMWGAITLNGWCWCIFMLYIGMRHLNFTNRFQQYAQTAILPFFVLHQPVIIILSYFVVQWNWGLWPKLLTVVIGAFAICVGIYELVIKRVGFLRAAFGMKG